MKLTGKMCLMIILKFTKNQGFTLSLEDTFFENRRRGRSNYLPHLPPSHPVPPLSLAVLGLNDEIKKLKI